jgi:phospholipase/lecithinase/hemolysin
MDRRLLPCPLICLEDLRRAPNAKALDEIMVQQARYLTGHLNTLLAEGATKVEIQWINRLDAVDNPLGEIGNFNILGERP